MVDIDEYLSTTTLSEKSKKTYKQAHKKLTDGLENAIVESSQRAIIQTIPTLTSSLNSQQALINIAIILFRANGKKLEMLDAAREATKQKIIEERNKGNAVKLDTLPSRKQIDDYLNKLYNDGEWRSYVINYLLANIYVRNKDVNALIVDRVGKDKNENYIVNRKNDVLFVRRDYKTKGTYGEKQNQIKSAKLKKAVEQLQKESEQKETPLLAKINGQRIGDDSLTNYIKERTKNNITESDMMKITINQIDETGDLRKLKMISDNRGTSIRTLIDNYKLKGFATEDVDDKVKVTNDKGMDLMVTVPVPVPTETKAQDTAPSPKPEPKKKGGRPKKGEGVNAEIDKEFILFDREGDTMGGYVDNYGILYLEEEDDEIWDVYDIRQFDEMYNKYVVKGKGDKETKLKNLLDNLDRANYWSGRFFEGFEVYMEYLAGKNDDWGERRDRILEYYTEKEQKYDPDEDDEPSPTLGKNEELVLKMRGRLKSWSDVEKQIKVEKKKMKREREQMGMEDPIEMEKKRERERKEEIRERGRKEEIERREKKRLEKEEEEKREREEEEKKKKKEEEKNKYLPKEGTILKTLKAKRRDAKGNIYSKEYAIDIKTDLVYDKERYVKSKKKKFVVVGRYVMGLAGKKPFVLWNDDVDAYAKRRGLID